MSGDSACVEELRARLAREESLSVEDWMGVCLAHYYGRGQAIGQAGDFITAPECTQVFGEVVGLWAAVVWGAMGRPDPVNLVELGPGRGTLMADALRALRPVPAFAQALRVHLVETSPTLREQQRCALDGTNGIPVTWHANLKDVPPGPTILIGNEFLDALPIQQYLRDDEGWRERRVIARSDVRNVDDLVLAFALGPVIKGPPPLFRPAHRTARPGEFVEICPAAHQVIRSLAERFRHSAGAVLFLDYGPAKSTPGDSLQALEAHTFAPLLSKPGCVDLTAHVDFESLLNTAQTAGAAVEPLATQGAFLSRLGFRERTMVLASQATSASQRGALLTAMDRLLGTSGDAMGRLFKVMAFRSPDLPALPGFVD